MPSAEARQRTATVLEPTMHYIRFSMAGGNPTVPDNTFHRGLAASCNYQTAVCTALPPTRHPVFGAGARFWACCRRRPDSSGR